MTDSDNRAASGSTTLPLGAQDEKWDAGEAEKAMDGATQLKRFHFWQDPNGDPAVKGSYKLPFGTPTGGDHAVWAGVKAAAQRLSQTQIPDADKTAIQAKIDTYKRKAAKKYNDPSLAPASSNAAGDEELELRFIMAPLTHVEVRDPTGNPDDTWTMSGYAAVFNQAATLYDGKLMKISESIHPAAFDRAIREQGLSRPEGVVHFNHGHDMMSAVAATDVPANQPGSLDLRPDAHGLFYLAKVPKDDPDGVRLAVKLRTGVVKQASFAFTVGSSEWTDTENADGPDESHRLITEVKHLYDVCACAQGAYPQTVSNLRSYAAAIGQPIPLLGVGGQPRQPDLGGASTVTRDGGSGGATAAERAAAHAAAAAALHRKERQR